MQATQAPQFYQALNSLAEMFDRTLTPNVLEMYFAALADLTIEQATTACIQAATNCKFFPKPVELRELVQGTANDQADAAWALLWQALEKGAGQYHSCYVADGVLAAALVRCWGGVVQAYDALAALDASEPMYASNRNAFRSAYSASLREQHEPRYFAGRTEIHNRNVIWPHDREDTVVCIGRKVAALRMPFSGKTGELLPEAKTALLTGNGPALQAFLPQPMRVALPEVASGEVVPMPDDVREFLAQRPKAQALLQAAQSAEPEAGTRGNVLPMRKQAA